MYIFKILIVYLTSYALVFILKPRSVSLYGNSIYITFAAAFIFYSGTVIADNETPFYYSLMYFIFLFVLCVSYHLFYKMMCPLAYYSGIALDFYGKNIFTPRISKMIILFFIILSLIPLIVPNFRLGLFLNPPAPEIKNAFFNKLNGHEDAFLKLVSSIKIIILPIFYLALYLSRVSIQKVTLCLLLVFYIEYLEYGYKSRGELITTCFPIFFYIWFFEKKYRKYIVFFIISGLPFIFVFFNFYEAYRLGVDVNISDFSTLDSILYIINKETNFPKEVGIPIIEQNARVDFYSYLIWVFTLPMPKFLFGDIPGARINTEISEIFLNIKRGGEGFYIVLPGLIADSVYIYGEYFFWIQAIFFGFFIALITRICQRNASLVFLVGYFSILMAYNTNRGGVASILPMIVNGLLLLYMMIFIYLFIRKTVPRK